MSKIDKTNFQRTKEWLQACGKEPSLDSAAVQYGCHIEEFVELITGISIFCDYTTKLDIEESIRNLTRVATKLKSGEARIAIDNPQETLDALCDGEVTGNGFAYCLGYDKESADQDVLFANDDKLENGKPVLLPGGKIGKREGWVAPDLSEYVK